MSDAPPPIYPTWPPQPSPPAPPHKRARWVSVAAAAGTGAIIAGVATTFITVAATKPTPTSTTASTPETVTETAHPAPPAPLPAEQADARTCRGWSMTDTLFTAAAVAQGVIPDGMTIIDPEVQENPAWRTGVLRASELYSQAADTFESQIAPGTSQILADAADTTVSSLRAVAETYKTFDVFSSYAVAVYKAEQDVLDDLCQ